MTQTILVGDGGIADAVEQASHLMQSHPGVDAVTASLTVVAPESTAGWVNLRDRVWLREWNRPGVGCSVVPAGGDGSPRALTLPWLSPLARVDVVTVIDTELLPPEAEQDRVELLACGVRASATRTIAREGVLYGSLAIARETPGEWDRTVIADLRLLTSALASRLAEVRARTSLADAIERGDQARDAQTHFFAAVGHELRTPIAAILGSAEIMAADAHEFAEGAGSVDASTFARTVQSDASVVISAGEQLLAIVEELLSTGQELGARTERGPVAIESAVGDVLHWLRTTARTADVNLGSHVPDGLHASTTPSALRQILTNLVGNAIAYHRPGGSVHVSASRAIDEFGDPRIRIRVQDDGPGLTTKQQREVFKPFVRFADPEIKGTGLGLPLSRTLAERDGGLMGVESVPGEGSSFWVDLPAAPAAEAPSAEAAAEADPDDRLAGSGQHSPA
ncbi:sensor histidine kinase [Nocardioides pantholopis]|uniref:sensor histidine kinase n=1 Tax=Nocardioides pantholopis TaxID=2483798 RepID=UPI0013DDB541|nr:HAMP domain-containing sensor histidine kinase [Nocardioides pantholopis]